MTKRRRWLEMKKFLGRRLEPGKEEKIKEGDQVSLFEGAELQPATRYIGQRPEDYPTLKFWRDEEVIRGNPDLPVDE